MEIAEDDDEEDRRRAVEMREAVAKRLRDSVEKELRLAADVLAEDGRGVHRWRAHRARVRAFGRAQ